MKTEIPRRAALATLLAAPAILKAQAEPRPDFRIGAIADCQYADEPDNGQRLYRLSPAKLRAAVTDFNRQELAFAVHLGDFIDKDWSSFDALLPIAGQFQGPWHFTLGNHDFLVADDKKPLVAARLGMPARYYKFASHDWLFVALDGNDVSSYAWPTESPELAASMHLHDEQYPRASLWNGALGAAQMRWLDETLTKADHQGRKVMLMCHFPVYPDNPNNLWNAADVLALIDRHPSVRIWLNGHNHDGNYGIRNSVQYLNLHGMLDTQQTAYAVLDFYADRIAVNGRGRERDVILPLR
ncbi:MAG TPA: metallophosphoesterase [Rhizomicrobium sp.]|jgi:calcineurin-like phosphoesterase family protein